MHSNSPRFADLILPLSVDGTFTYEIPPSLRGDIAIGKRVEVEFGKRKHYAALVYRISDYSQWEKPKTIINIIDEEPLISETQMKFWEWMSGYYLCSLGEIFLAALPLALRPDSETLIHSLIDQKRIPQDASEDEYLILEALDIRKELRMQEIQEILQKKTVLKTLYKMFEKRWISMIEKLDDSTTVQKISWIRLNPALTQDLNLLNEALNQIQRSERQSKSLITYLQHQKDKGWIKRKFLQQLSGTPIDVTQSLIKKEIFEEIQLDKFEYPAVELATRKVSLSSDQEKIYQEIRNQPSTSKPILLHGITGSGKTMIYLRLIEDVLNEGKQVLYLLPEIALTAQLVQRLRQYLGDQLLEYHSDLNPKSKLAVWNSAKKTSNVFIGARSSIFLPFHSLGLIIVDEEHDASYKQHDPSPRYQARDAAVVLSKMHECQIILGSATPSLESYYNTLEGKYKYMHLNTRFGESELPKIETVSMKSLHTADKKKSHFSEKLVALMQEQFQRGKQVIIFRNRRGYSPLLQCNNCHWESSCRQCDIRLTLHKQQNKMKCHLCGFTSPVPSSCPNCGQYTLQQLGFGTEQIEESLQELFPQQKLVRLDLEIARSRNMQQRIIESFQDQEADILVGTQMVTKGLDFDHVGMVGILQADQILFYPDFRAQERAFQLLTQVSGRAGRRADQGIVIIQGYQVHHPVIQFVIEHKTQDFYEKELEERKKFVYPPFVRLIRIQLLHRKVPVVEQASSHLCKLMKTSLGKRVLGPSEPHISRIKGSYVRELLIKIEKDSNQLHAIKLFIKQWVQTIQSIETFRSIRIHIDVDP